MQLPDSALQAYSQVKERLVPPEATPFWQTGIVPEGMLPAIMGIIQFVIDRPAMLVADAMRTEEMLVLANTEWYEAEVELAAENPECLGCELADTAFFAILAGLLHWEEYSEAQRSFIRDAYGWAQQTANEQGIDLASELWKVAMIKNRNNYKEELYQIGADERTEDMVEKVLQASRVTRGMRRTVNGRWVSSRLEEILTDPTLREHESPEVTAFWAALQYIVPSEMLLSETV